MGEYSSQIIHKGSIVVLYMSKNHYQGIIMVVKECWDSLWLNHGGWDRGLVLFLGFHWLLRGSLKLCLWLRVCNGLSGG
jgi:hypothetical protein